MSKFEKIVYLSDKIEFSRQFKDLEPIRALAEKKINAAMRLCLTEVFLGLKRDGRQMHPLSLDLWKDLHKRHKKALVKVEGPEGS